MTTSNDTILENIFKSITYHSSESDVEKKIVIPLLHLLGYSDIDWRSQFIIGKSKLDFLVRPKFPNGLSIPYLVIEVKAPKEKITHKVWQINKYMRQTGAILGILTNGYYFQILYNYKSQITNIAEYSQLTFIKKHEALHSILSKETCLGINKSLYHSYQKIRYAFARSILNKLDIEESPELVNKDANSKLASRTLLPSKVDIKEHFVVGSSKERTSMIITVFNNKGGVGKTTMTINLAAALSKMGKRVLLIDIDGQANLTTGLGIDPLVDVEVLGKKDITHLLTEPVTKLEDTIIKKRWRNVELHLVPSHIRLSYMENELNTTIDIDRVLETKLRSHNYDFVFIDPPPAFGRVNSISLMASSAILIPTQLSAYPIRALEYVLERINKVQMIKTIPILGIAVSMYDQKATNFNPYMTEKLFELLERKGWANKLELFSETTWIPRLNIVSISQDKGYPLYEAEFDDKLTYQDKEAAQKALERYTELAKKLTEVSLEKS